MTTTEDVLQVVNHVRHKKSDGTLYVMAERVAWIMNGKDTFSISHNYADIKMQKISPDGKSKVQLQVVLHNGGASTFHFTHPEGVEAQVQDRDATKELLQQLLPRFKRKVNKELEEKNRILAEDPELFQLYRDLVTSQVISPEEFWASHTPQNDRLGGSGSSQDVGVSGAFLADIKPQTDGCNGLKYNLTADVIESIFKTYPAVKKKHLDNVPDKLSESEFWTRFFQSHYFHRDRLNTGTKDLFAECVKSDEQDIARELTSVVRDPLLDLTSFVDSQLEEGYGDSGPSSTSHPTGNAVNQNMIRRFNHHSMMVLKVCEGPSAKESGDDKTNANVTPQLNGLTRSNHQKNAAPAPDTIDSGLPPNKQARIQSKLVYEDLLPSGEQSSPALNLTRADRYLHGPTPVTSADYASNEELLQAVHMLNEQVATWRPNLEKVLSNPTAVGVLGELSPGGVLMKGASLTNLQQSVPQPIQQELKHLYAALGELLRHFWSCFPVTSEFLEEKVVRMRANLERFQYAKILPFQDTLLRDHHNTNLINHLNEMIEVAFAKFSAWQSRRLSTGRK